MDYEKKYKDALEIAQKLYQDCPNGKNDRLYHTTDLEKMFPELRESEDEKIRKELIEHIKDQQSSFISAPDCRDKYEEEENNKYNSWLAWLEKQGEHKKFRDSIQVGDEVTRNSDGVIVNLSQLKRVAKKSEQKLPIEKLPSEMKTIRESLGFTTQEECDEYNEMVTNLIMGDDDKGEQKTALSEKDREMIDETLYFIREYQQSNRCKDENDMQNSVTCEKWLKSLKERIGGEQ